MASSVVPLCAVGCTTIVGNNRPEAMETVAARAKFDLNCPDVGTLVLSEEIVPGYPTEGSEHTIGVAGCGREAVYVAHCTDATDCKVVRQKGQDEAIEPEVVAP